MWNNNNAETTKYVRADRATQTNPEAKMLILSFGKAIEDGTT